MNQFSKGNSVRYLQLSIQLYKNDPMWNFFKHVCMLIVSLYLHEISVPNCFSLHCLASAVVLTTQWRNCWRNTNMGFTIGCILLSVKDYQQVMGFYRKHPTALTTFSIQVGLIVCHLSIWFAIGSIDFVSKNSHLVVGVVSSLHSEHCLGALEQGSFRAWASFPPFWVVWTG